jgi:hypothetical protein
MPLRSQHFAIDDVAGTRRVNEEGDHMSGTDTSIANATRVAHLAVIDGAAGRIDKATGTAWNRLNAQGRTTAYSAAAQGTSVQERAQVRAVASTAGSFDKALRSMVIAAGVPERDADVVTAAIRGNDALLEKAKAAFDQIQQGNV